MTLPLSAKTPAFKEPDMAFPQTVADHALAELSKGNLDGYSRLRYTLEYIAAQTAIDPERAFAMPGFIAEQSTRKGVTAADRSMFLLMQARTLADIYSRDSWKYRRVDAPLQPIPAKISEWSQGQFAHVTDSLLREASSLCGATPLQQYSEIISPTDFHSEYFTTLHDFYGAVALSISNEFRYSSFDKRSELLESLLNSSEGQPIWYYWKTMQCDDSDELLSLYTAHAHDEAARYLLYTASQHLGFLLYSARPSEEELKEETFRTSLINALESSLKEFPHWYGNKALETILRDMRRPVTAFEIPDMCAPGEDITLYYALAFNPEATFHLYALPGSTTLDDITDGVLVKSYTVQSPNPAAVVRDTISIRIPSPGKYRIVTTIGEEKASRDLLATSFLPIVGNGLAKYPVITADFTTGAPARGVAVENVPYGRYGAPAPLPSYVGKTDRDGILIAEAPGKNGGRLRFQHNGHIMDFGGDYSQPTAPSKAKPREAVICMSDRALYHPGDTIKWMAAIARGDADSAAIVPGKALTISLRDANGQGIDTITCTTDRNGRCHGSFDIPTGRLTGSWSLRIESQNTVLYQHYFTVSDFRLPVFEVTVDAIARNVPAEGAVTIRGKAVTYSVMPVAGAQVDLRLTGAYRWRWFSPAEQISTLKVTTDATGTFEVEIPATILTAPTPSGQKFNSFIADITVTSVTAETASTSANFTTGKPYVLTGSMKQDVIDTDGVASFSISAFGADGKDAVVAVDWSMTATDGPEKGRVVRSGRCKTPTTASISLEGIPAATYTLSLAAADSTLADTAEDVISFTTYNERQGLFPPTAGHLFVPRSEYTLASGKAAVLIATPDDEAYVYEIIHSGGELRSVHLHTLTRGFTTLNISSEADTKVEFATVWQGAVSTYSVNLAKPVAPQPRIVASAFRDRLVPGTNEVWTLRLVDGADKGMAAIPMVATMYTKALDALESYRMPSAFALPKYNPSMWLNYVRRGFNEASCGSPWISAVLSIGTPSFRYLSEMLDGMMVTTAMYGTRAPMKNSAMMRMAKAEAADAVEAEAADEEVALTAGAGEAAAEAGGSADEKFQYRPAEVLQAFWKPTLVSDSEGNVNLVFTVPDANTTWQLRALAWTPGASVLRYDATAVASKPVMVQPFVPRFLRQGDDATISATVFNNSTEDATVEVVTELFDIVSGEVTQRSNEHLNIAAGASAVTSIDLAVAADAATIGYRVKATTAGFSDGEQAAIPVLEAATTVMESTQFYLNPGDSTPATVTVDGGDDVTLVLQYIQNPVWTVVKAMRGIYGREINTSPALASRIFSYLAARHIVASNPGVAHALREWTANPSEQALTSMLERNEDLKRLVLCQTPWVTAAASNTQRMATLASVLEPTAVKAALDKAVEALEKLQNSDGGFSWGSWSRQSSSWSTESVLITLGLARSMGMLPADERVTQLIAPAFDFLVAETLKEKDRRPSYPGLTLIAALMPELPRTGRVAPLLSTTVEYIRSHWKEDAVVGKAYDVLILNSFGARGEAETVMSSIRQFAVPSATKGTSFPSVTDIRSYATIIQAYAAMGTPKAEIDALRQWIIIRAQATDDLGAYNPDYVIASVLLTGSVWTDVPVQQSVTINGAPLAIDRMESASGYFSQRLAASGDKVVVTVHPNGVTPSYGSIMSISRRPMLEVKARPGEDISIEKRMLVERDGQWVETDAFALGERVRVQLLLHVDRVMEYVSIDDERPAAFEPVEQLPGYVWNGSLAFYRENLDASTRLFIDYLPKGTYYITYDMTAAVAGSFVSGTATLQSSYAPELTAHSSAAQVRVMSYE